MAGSVGDIFKSAASGALPKASIPPVGSAFALAASAGRGGGTHAQASPKAPQAPTR